MDKTNELELNRWAHELLGQCWHETRKLSLIERIPVAGWTGRVKGYKLPALSRECLKCGKPITPMYENGVPRVLFPRLPDYCSSLDLAAKVEAKAIEMVGEDRYFREVLTIIKSKDAPETLLNAIDCITAPALTRVEAAKRAVEGKNAGPS